MMIPSFCLKYKVLKPQPSLTTLAKSLQKVENCKYLLAITADRAVRKYRDSCASIEQLLQLAEWRFDAGSQVAHCYFLQLLKPDRETRAIEYQVYIEHVQMVLGEMSKLIAQESLYLLIESAKGYQELFSKFKRTAVNPNTIGLNSQGRCIVWHNAQLNSFQPSNDALTNQTEIIIKIIEEVRARSEPHCQWMLIRLGDDVLRKQFSLSTFIQHVTVLAGSMKITMPQDLRYLVNQNKILREVRNIKLKTDTTQEPQKIKLLESRVQKYRPVKTETRENMFAGTQVKPRVKRDHRMSQANMLKGVRVASSFESKKFVTEKDITRKKESYLSTNMSSFIASSDKKWSVLRHRSKCTDEEDSNHHHFSKSRERTVISKCKSSEGHPNSNISVIHARPFERLNFQEKDSINPYQHQKSSINYGYNSHYSDRANSFRHKEPARKETKKVYKSFVVEFGKSIAQKNKCIGEECEEHESSPNKEKAHERNEFEERVNQSSEGLEQAQAEDVLKANQWTKNLDSHQLWVESKLNTSITLGQEKCTYLDDIKLQKLQMLSRQMAISRLPDDISQPILSQTIIE